MSPPPLAAISGSAACVQNSSPQQVHVEHPPPVRRCRRRATGPSSITPALLTSTCRPPSSAWADSMNARACCSSDTSTSWTRHSSLEPRCELLEAVAPPRGERDRRAGARERHRGSLADARRSAGDRGHAACEAGPPWARDPTPAIARFVLAGQSAARSRASSSSSAPGGSGRVAQQRMRRDAPRPSPAAARPPRRGCTGACGPQRAASPRGPRSPGRRPPSREAPASRSGARGSIRRAECGSITAFVSA